MDPTVELSRQLIQRRSVTPDDCGCIDLISERLSAVGFDTERLEFGEVTNGWIRHGSEGPLFVFAGHTDVVPPGPEDQWTHPPFDAVIAGDTLYGRGAADMKTGVAAMTIACEEFVTENPDHKGSIGLLLTSDEEGPAVDGTVKVIQYLSQQNIAIDYCLVAEPSSTKTVGDEIKNGRRGSLNGHVTITGKQGHVAYPHLAKNPIHQMTEALAELQSIEWDSGNEHFPATTFQVSNIQSGTGAENVIPDTAEAWFNFRFSTETTSDQIQHQVEKVLANRDLNFEVRWKLSGDPFLTSSGRLIDACRFSIQSVTGTQTRLSTGGGTSDGRFIATVCNEVVELGVVNATIHQIDEQTNIHELMHLKDIYKAILSELLA